MPRCAGARAARAVGRMMECCSARSPDDGPAYSNGTNGKAYARPPSVLPRESPAVASCLEDVTTADMGYFRTLEAKNQALMQELGYRDDEVPEVSKQVAMEVTKHIKLLQRAASENVGLRGEIATMQDELERLVSTEPTDVPEGAHVSLPRMPQTAPILGRQTSQPSRSRSRQLADGIGSGGERSTADVLAEIQNTTQGNIEMISHFDRQIRELEDKLAAAQQQLARQAQNAQLPDADKSFEKAFGTEAQAMQALRQRTSDLYSIERECERLRVVFSHESSRQQDASLRMIQELQLEHEVQLEEIGHLRKLLRRRTEEGPVDWSLPGTSSLLQAEHEQLREHLAQQNEAADKERTAVEQHGERLRSEAVLLKEQLQAILARRAEAMRALEDLQRLPSVRDLKAVAGREQEDQRLHGEQLGKDSTRARRRLELIEEHARSLQLETDDIRQRSAALALRATPGNRDGSPQSEHLVELQRVVQQLTRELQAARLSEDSLREENADAQKALDDNRVEAAVMEQKMKLLQSRNRPPKTM